MYLHFKFPAIVTVSDSIKLQVKETILAIKSLNIAWLFPEAILPKPKGKQAESQAMISEAINTASNICN